MRFTHIWNWRTIVVFALAGPPLGAVVWFVSWGPSDTGWLAAAQAFPSWLLIAIPLSYVIGFMPALLTGLLTPVLWLIGSIGGSLLLRAASAALVGAVVTFLFRWLVFGSEDLGGPVSLVGIGAVAAALCAIVASRWVGPNKSFKPTPLRGAA